MLKELKITEYAYDKILGLISGVKYEDAGLITHAPGVYEPNAHKYNGDSWLRDMSIKTITYDYGVCDDYTQILKHHNEIVDSEHEYVITLSHVVKSKQPSSGGWRWHKWGEYIGTLNPECEYIYDEDDSINEVFCYTIHRILQ